MIRATALFISHIWVLFPIFIFHLWCPFNLLFKLSFCNEAFKLKSIERFQMICRFTSISIHWFNLKFGAMTLHMDHRPPSKAVVNIFVSNCHLLIGLVTFMGEWGGGEGGDSTDLKKLAAIVSHTFSRYFQLVFISSQIWRIRAADWSKNNAGKFSISVYRSRSPLSLAVRIFLTCL